MKWSDKSGDTHHAYPWLAQDATATLRVFALFFNHTVTNVTLALERVLIAT